MLSIYVCENDRWQLEKYVGIINKIILEEKLTEKIEISCATHDPDELISKLKTDTSPGLFFLDVELDPGVMNGIQLGLRIRELNPNAYIVMVTVHADAAPIIFKEKVCAKDFIIKDQTSEMIGRFKSCINDAYESSRCNVVDFYDFVINENEIYCIQSIPGKRVLHMYGRYKTMQIHSTLEEVEEKLDSTFVRCHRSTIVNLRHIVGINKKNRKAILEDGMEVPISFRHMNELLKKYTEHLK